MKRFVLLFAVLLLPATLGVALDWNPAFGGEDDANEPPAERNEPDAKKPETSKRKAGPFDAALLEAAKKYAAWDEVDNLARWAPTLCSLPPAPRARMSAAEAKGGHSRKIYFLFAKDRDAYLAATAKKPKEQPIGQILVKQAHAPVAVDKLPPYPKRIGGLVPARTETGATNENAAPTEGETNKPKLVFKGRDPYVKDGEKVYRAGEINGLFVMMKLDPKTAGTDQGWVYGTINPKTNSITAAGRIQSCMKCHKDAATDRMFGYPNR